MAGQRTTRVGPKFRGLIRAPPGKPWRSAAMVEEQRHFAEHRTNEIRAASVSPDPARVSVRADTVVIVDDLAVWRHRSAVAGGVWMAGCSFRGTRQDGRRSPCELACNEPEELLVGVAA